MRTYISLLILAVVVNLIFAYTTMLFFHGEIEGAHTFGDYFFYAVGSLTTSGHGTMMPKSLAAKIWTSMYVIVAWVYIFYVAINHVREVEFRLFG